MGHESRPAQAIGEPGTTLRCRGHSQKLNPGIRTFQQDEQ